jgi:hypothetical protein
MMASSHLRDSAAASEPGSDAPDIWRSVPSMIKRRNKTHADSGYVEDLLPLKTKASVSYVGTRSLSGDIKIMLATFKAIIHPAPSARLPKDLETR